ncbi:DUF6119 family protein, partial [Chromobacterium piscinae]
NVTWWESYKPFIKKTIPHPKNIFHYGLLIAIPNDKRNQYIFLASLGKSHFYLNKFIDRDFGISFGIRVANGDSILLKKSHYFTGIKKGDIASYQSFNQNNFIAGESVDHLKLKPIDTETWGEGSIILSDSIQISLTQTPENFDEVIEKIDATSSLNITIDVPKLEKESDTLIINELDENLINSIKNKSGLASITEFNVYGSRIYLSSDIFKYELIKTVNRKYEKIEDIGNELTVNKISEFILKEGIKKPDEIKIRSTNSYGEKLTQNLKDALDFRISHGEDQYITKNGHWYYFNDKFIDFLKKSLQNIPLIKKDDLLEIDYIQWKQAKEIDIRNGLANNKITYREYYFNEKMALTGYQLFDRITHNITTLANVGNNYRVEMADLYHNGEIISLKISDDKIHLIYNIIQSATALELYCKETIKTTYNINTASIWMVCKENINSIFDLNSIQLLLAIENWREKAASYGLATNIYISQHIK